MLSQEIESEKGKFNSEGIKQEFYQAEKADMEGYVEVEAVYAANISDIGITRMAAQDEITSHRIDVREKR